MPDGPIPDGAIPAPAQPDAALGVARSLGGRRWLWREGEPRDVAAIVQRHDVPEIVARVLAARGVDAERAADFLAPTLRALLPDPSCLADMDAAAARLAHAVAAGETVAVFGDYDVDGACSAAVMVVLLRGLGCTVLPYVPDRMTEGYGPNAPALQALAARGASLFVCVDCGTAAAEPLAALAGRADVIVLDHHKAEGIPPVLATVNPNRLDCRSGLGHLCAAGVAFLAAVATVRALRRQGWFAHRAEPDLRALLDLVALATVCDVMPLTGLNRALVGQGLRVMARRARPGIAALLELAASREAPTAVTCGYGLGPRINAGGRIGEAGLGLRLLLATDAAEARTLAETLDGVNRQRQTVEAGMLDCALAEAAAQFEAGRAVACVFGPEWHPGVVGIVAGRIKEKFNRPACVGGIAEGRIRGSGRSVAGLDLGAAVILARQRGILDTGGGHAMAAGFSLPVAGADAFRALLEERLAAARLLPGAADLLVEGTVAVAAATVGLATALDRLAPFGHANEEPMLVLPRVRVVRADRVGREGGTVRAHVAGEDGLGRLKAMLFRAGDGALATALLTRPGVPLHLAGHLRAEAWNGAVAPCLTVRDAALA